MLQGRPHGELTLPGLGTRAGQPWEKQVNEHAGVGTAIAKASGWGEFVVPL